MVRSVTASLFAMDRIAAQPELEVVRQDGGSKQSLVIITHVPVLSSGGDWQCAVTYNGFRSRSFVIYGVDSWQALILAQRTVRGELQVLQPHLRYLGEPVDIETLFGDA